MKTQFDFVILGGGFYGSCLALFLSSISDKIAIVETSDGLLQRASSVNQARVHTGFHYPRSPLTAVKSLALYKKFASDFADAVIDDFEMLYAISINKSKVTAKRFFKMFSEMNAPLSVADSERKKIFNKEFVDEVYVCSEFAFNHEKLSELLGERIEKRRIKLFLSQSCEQLVTRDQNADVVLSGGTTIKGSFIFNITYSNINQILLNSGLSTIQLKHELCEIAHVSVPSELKKIGITVIDGPFFSCMPFPASGNHSLTHVRYTPHCSWTDYRNESVRQPFFSNHHNDSKFEFMRRDAMRYVPMLGELKHLHSSYEIKTVLIQNETDDGRPILFHQSPENNRIISVMGGKLDNVYDLFTLIKSMPFGFHRADDRFVVETTD